jgi:DNA transformation protein
VRNSKIRRRIAAGKLRLRIRDLRNLGPRSEAQLASVGIATVQQLRERGAVDAYLALRRAGVTRSLNALWAMAGALEPWPEGRAWQEVASSEDRLPLLLEVESREKARGAVLEALGVEAPGRRRAQQRQGARSGARTEEPPREEAWAPGLPFEEPQKRKNRR